MPTRREVLGVTAAAFATSLPAARSEAAVADMPPAAEATISQIVLSINGKTATLGVEPRTTLLDALREELLLTGTKKGCDHGSCGACTVHIDGKRVVSCLTLAQRCEGKQIVTIEGLAEGGKLHPMQQAFLEHDGYQCGYCTPGQIMSAVALVHEGHTNSDNEIREWMSGNICRCGAYPNIVAAIKDVAAATEG
jgi:xanthine dehydrogenase YagT iron-sulfur-binding subunit